MNTPGSILRTEREKQNRSLKDISTDLKIKTEYLKALEDDNYEVLPAEIYTKSYIRLYADSLHIKHDYIIELYNNLTHPPQPEGEDEDTKKKDEHHFDPVSLIVAGPEHGSSAGHLSAVRFLNYKTVLLFASIVLLAVFIGFIFNRDEEKTVATSGEIEQKETVPSVADEQKTPPASTATALQETAVTAPDSIDKKAAPSAGKQNETPASTGAARESSSSGADRQKPAATDAESKHNKPAPAVRHDERKAAEESAGARKEAAQAAVNKVAEAPPAESVAAGKLSLKVLATDITWVSVSIDGGTRREWALRKDGSLTLEADKKFSIKVGNAGGTRLFLNGKDIGTLGPSGKVTDIVLP